MKKKHEIGKSIIRDMGDVREETQWEVQTYFLIYMCEILKKLNINMKETNDREKD